MATDLTEFSPEILPSIPVAPVPTIRLAVLGAAIEFCEQTLLWTYALARINVAAEIQDYTLTIPAEQYGRIISIDDVKFKENGADDDQFRSLDVISENQEDLHNYGSWKYAEGESPSKYWADIQNKQIHLLPIPQTASAEGLLVRVNLKPVLNATTVPDFLYNDYRETIGYGALGRLFQLKTMPWFDFGAARFYKDMFRDLCNNTKLAKITGATKRPLQIKLRRFA